VVETSVSGLFTTTSGARHAGGFVGGVPPLVEDITPDDFVGNGGTAPTGGNPAVNAEGFLSANLLVVPGVASGTSYLFTPNIDNVALEANSSSPATAMAAYLAQFKDDGRSITRGTMAGGVFKDSMVTPAIGYGGTNLIITVNYDALKLAGLATLNDFRVRDENDDHSAFTILSGGAELSGDTPEGEYTWDGVQVVKESATESADPALTEDIRFTATFTGTGQQTITVATQGTSKTNNLSGKVNVNLANGAITDNLDDNLNLAAGGGSGTVTVFGQLHGDRAVSLSGVFANSAAINGKFYSGGFVASGAIQLFELGTGATVDRSLDGSGPLGGRGKINATIGTGGQEREIYFTSVDFGVLARQANSPSESAREAALFNNIDPTFATDNSGLTLSPSQGTYGESVNFGFDTNGNGSDENVNLLTFKDRAGHARLGYFRDSGQEAPGTVFVYGDDFSGSITGTFKYYGTQVFGYGTTRSSFRPGGGSQSITASAITITAIFQGPGGGGNNTELRYRSPGSGDYEINASNIWFNQPNGWDGTFTGSVTLPGSDFHNLTVYGRFHGNGGAAVTGVVFGNERQAYRFGAFVASRAIYQGFAQLADSEFTNEGADNPNSGIITGSYKTPLSEQENFVTAYHDDVASVRDGYAQINSNKALLPRVLDLDTSVTGTGTNEFSTAAATQRDISLTQGKTDLGGSDSRLRIWSLGDDSAKLYLLGTDETTNNDFIASVGIGASSTRPTSGKVTYTGLMVSGTSDSLKDATTSDFMLTANFLAAATGSTLTISSSLFGQSNNEATAGTIDTATGTFSFADVTLGAATPGNDRKRKSDIIGRFHGANWTSVSGIWASDDEDAKPTVAGGLLGYVVRNDVSALSTFSDATATNAGGIIAGSWASLETGAMRLVHALAPGISGDAGLVATLNQTVTTRSDAISAILDFDSSTLTADATKDVGTITYSSGTAPDGVMIGGAASTIGLYEDSAGGAAIYLVATTTGDDIALASSSAGAIVPTSGSISYSGVVVESDRAQVGDTSNTSTSFASGTFNMTVNFMTATTATFTFASTGLGTQLGIATGQTTGAMTIGDGRFLSTTNFVHGTEAATLYGQFHGATSNGVSGLWHLGGVNAANPTKAGAFLGRVPFSYDYEFTGSDGGIQPNRSHRGAFQDRIHRFFRHGHEQ